jgi:hypothetical protein
MSTRGDTARFTSTKVPLEIVDLMDGGPVELVAEYLVLEALQLIALAYPARGSTGPR